MTIAAVPPASVPRWATNGGTRVAPGESQKDTGWTPGQRPPAQVENWLTGLAYDWQQYFKSATDQLEASKIDKTGAADLSGDFVPTTDLGANLGTSARRFDNVRARNVEVNGGTVALKSGTLFNMETGALVVGDFIPRAADFPRPDLGTAAARWGNLFLSGGATISGASTFASTLGVTGRLTLGENILPTNAGSQNGNSLNPWNATTSRSVLVRNLWVYDKSQPSIASDLYKVSSQAKTLGQGIVVSNANLASPTTAAIYNGVLTRTATGVYRFTFAFPFASSTDYVCVCSVHESLSFRHYYIGRFTNYVEIRWFSDVAMTTAVDTLFSFLVSGIANGGADPIS